MNTLYEKRTTLSPVSTPQLAKQRSKGCVKNVCDRKRNIFWYKSNTQFAAWQHHKHPFLLFFLFLWCLDMILISPQSKQLFLQLEAEAEAKSGKFPWMHEWQSTHLKEWVPNQEATLNVMLCSSMKDTATWRTTVTQVKSMTYYVYFSLSVSTYK